MHRKLSWYARIWKAAGTSRVLGIVAMKKGEARLISPRIVHRCFLAFNWLSDRLGLEPFSYVKISASFGNRPPEQMLRK